MFPRYLLRPMSEKDVPHIAEIDRDCYPFPWTSGNFSSALMAGNRCCVYEEAGEIVAYAVAMSVLDEIHLLNLTVTLSRQGWGYGRAMLRRLIACSRAECYASMWLEVRPSNHVARRLYDSMGFIQVGLRKNYYPAEQGREDAVLMCLDIKSC